MSAVRAASETVCLPVAPREPGERAEPAEGIGLCLSGGGYRAMLFHLGAIWRLNEWGYLPRLDRVSSVSGGSITAGVLALAWKRLRFRDGVAAGLEEHVVAPIRGLASRTIDKVAVLGGVFGPGTVGDRVVAAYDKHLFHGATLQDLPEDPPRFVINATNVQSGVLFRFSRPYLRDYRVGEVKNPTVPLAVAVAASSAFPPFLSPITLELPRSAWSPPTGGEDLHREPFTTDVVLTDGGVYDNLGLETVFKRYRTILVSNGGGRMSAEAEPDSDWARHSRRVLEVVDHQVRSLRQRQLIDAFERDLRRGAYWGIRTSAPAGEPGPGLACPPEHTLALAEVPTRLKALPPALQERLINWGYAACDAAMRKNLDRGLAAATAFPYPAVGVG
jgi:NTE family protein